MKRFTFLSALFSLPLLGQIFTRRRDEGVTRLWDAEKKYWAPESKPLNNQCPVCGTMAEPWTEVPVMYCASTDPQACEGVTFRRIDCEWCNTTFRQFAGPTTSRFSPSNEAGK